MALRHTRTTATTAAVTTALATALTVAGAVTTPAAADTYGPPRVTRDADARALVTAYDPGDELGFPGDTHVIEFDYLATRPVPLGMFVLSYTCGPHDRSKQPAELGCPDAAMPAPVVRRARVDVLADTRIRIRGTTTAGRFDVTLTGSESLPGWEPFVSREWRHAVGARREQGRTIAVDHLYATVVRGTFGGVALYQDPAWLNWSGMRVRTTTARTGTGPAVAVPDLPPPGTTQGEWRTYGVATASWLRRLPGAPPGTRDVEVGRITYDAGQESGDRTGASRNVQRCEPGERVVRENVPPPRHPCEVVDPGFGGSDGATAALDVAAGSLRVGLDLLPADPDGPATPVRFRWRGRQAVGFHEVETTRYDAVASAQTFTTEGVRWLRLDAGGTVAGERVDRVLDPTFSVYRRMRVITPPG